MDKIAVISDIHGNKSALEAVLSDIHSRNISRIFCLGDIVLKCSNPDIAIDGTVYILWEVFQFNY